MEKLLITGISADAALKWVRGDLTDKEVILNPPNKPQAVIAWGLGSKWQWREGLRLGVELWRAGALCYVTETENKIVLDDYLKRGAVVMRTKQKPHGLRVWVLMPPPAFNAWMQKITATCAYRKRFSPEFCRHSASARENEKSIFERKDLLNQMAARL